MNHFINVASKMDKLFRRSSLDIPIQFNVKLNVPNGGEPLDANE